MKLLDKLCKELGIEVGEKWLANDGYYYKITEDGMIGFYFPTSGYEKNFDIDHQLWVNLVTGDLKPVWVPEKGEEFHLIDLIDEDLYDVTFWSDSEINHKWLKRGLVFRTKEEAIKVAKKMIRTIKEEK